MEFWLLRAPFVAVDAIGVLPTFLSLSQGLEPQQVRRIILQSMATAAAVALTLVALGTAILNLLGITVADFMVAGGILLFVLAMGDLLANEKFQRRIDPDSLGAVPLGVPLITGPAVLVTSTLLVVGRQGCIGPEEFLLGSVSKDVVQAADAMCWWWTKTESLVPDLIEP